MEKVLLLTSVARSLACPLARSLAWISPSVLLFCPPTGSLIFVLHRSILSTDPSSILSFHRFILYSLSLSLWTCCWNKRRTKEARRAKGGQKADRRRAEPGDSTIYLPVHSTSEHSCAESCAEPCAAKLNFFR